MSSSYVHCLKRACLETKGSYVYLWGLNTKDLYQGEVYRGPKQKDDHLFDLHEQLRILKESEITSDEQHEEQEHETPWTRLQTQRDD